MADTVRATLQYDANFGPAIAQSRILATEVGKLNAQFNAFDAASQNLKKGLADTFRAGVGSVNGYTSKMVDMQTQTDIFSKRLQQNKLTMREYFSEAYRGVTRQDSMMRRFARDQLRFQQAIIAPTGVSVGGKQQGIAFIPDAAVITNSAEKMKLLSNEFNTFRHLVRSGATEMINFGKNTQWTGRQLTVGLTMPILLFGSTIAKVFMDVDKELTRFAKVYGGDLTANTTEATNLMKDQVLSLAKTISEQFGVAAKETAALAADIAATGLEGQKLLDTVSQTSRLAVLGDVDRQEAMKATLAMQSAFKLNTDELAESINFLNAVENQTSTTLNDLVEAIPKAGPVVKGLGGSIKDLSVLMVAMREGGIPASEAANAIKSGMASLINPTQKASEVARKFGVDLNAIVDANQGKFMPTIFAMQEALNGLDSFAKSKVIEEIFGKYQFARMTALFNNIGTAGSQSTKALELANASVDQLASTANQELTRLTESATVKFARAMETVKNVLLPIGSTLLDIVTPALTTVANLFETVGKFIGNLPEPLKNFLKTIGGLTLLAGPILMLGGLFTNLIGNGIKLAMGIASIGAKLAGIKVGDLQFLSQETVAAAAGFDNLTTKIGNQTDSLKFLNNEMKTYIASLQQVSANPTNLGINPNAPSAAPAPVKKQSGGKLDGYGGGDKIPALLEPGEFIVRKEMAAKYAPVLEKMNNGNLNGYKNGGWPKGENQNPLDYNTALSGVGGQSVLAGLPLPIVGQRQMLMVDLDDTLWEYMTAKNKTDLSFFKFGKSQLEPSQIEPIQRNIDRIRLAKSMGMEVRLVSHRNQTLAPQAYQIIQELGLSDMFNESNMIFNNTGGSAEKFKNDLAAEYERMGYTTSLLDDKGSTRARMAKNGRYAFYNTGGMVGEDGMPVKMGNGGLFLGQIRGFKDVEKARGLREMLDQTNEEATTGRFASMPVTELGNKVVSIGGMSSVIPGMNGIYEINGKKYAVKIHNTSDSALVEARGAALTSSIFGLKTPDQEVIKVKHPVTGGIVFAVRSPYDEAFAQTTNEIPAGNFYDQAIAAIVRRDKDLQADNLYGGIVSDVGAGFLSNKASQPREIGMPLPSVAEQAAINFLMTKGGARKWFAESTAYVAQQTTPEQYEAGFKDAIARASAKAEMAIAQIPDLTDQERTMYMRIVTDLKEANAIDWKSIHNFHAGIKPEVKKPPTEAALAKEKAAQELKARQSGGHMAAFEYGLPFGFAAGGMIPEPRGMLRNPNISKYTSMNVAKLDNGGVAGVDGGLLNNVVGTANFIQSLLSPVAGMMNSGAVSDFYSQGRGYLPNQNAEGFFAGRDTPTMLGADVLARIKKLNLSKQEELMLQDALQKHSGYGLESKQGGGFGSKMALAGLDPSIVATGSQALQDALTQILGDEIGTIRLYRATQTSAAGAAFGMSEGPIEPPQPYRSMSSDISAIAKFLNADPSGKVTSKIVEVDVPKSAIVGIAGVNYQTNNPQEKEFIVRSDRMPPNVRYIDPYARGVGFGNASDPFLSMISPVSSGGSRQAEDAFITDAAKRLNMGAGSGIRPDEAEAIRKIMLGRAISSGLSGIPTREADRTKFIKSVLGLDYITGPIVASNLSRILGSPSMTSSNMDPSSYGYMGAPLKFARGGKLPGYGGGDIIPAMLTPGEFVMNKASTKKYEPILNAMNRGGIAGYFTGGPSDEDMVSIPPVPSSYDSDNKPSGMGISSGLRKVTGETQTSGLIGDISVDPIAGPVLESVFDVHRRVAEEVIPDIPGIVDKLIESQLLPEDKSDEKIASLTKMANKVDKAHLGPRDPSRDIVGKTWDTSKLGLDAGMINSSLSNISDPLLGQTPEDIKNRAQAAVESMRERGVLLAFGKDENEMLAITENLLRTGQHPTTKAEQEALASLLETLTVEAIDYVEEHGAEKFKEVGPEARGTTVPKDVAGMMLGAKQLRAQQAMGVVPAEVTLTDIIRTGDEDLQRKASKKTTEKIDKEIESPNPRSVEATGSSPQEISAELQRMKDLAEKFDPATRVLTRGVAEQIARMPEEARKEILRIAPEFQKAGEAFGVDIAAGLIDGTEVGFAKEAETGSPSKKAARVGEEGGKNVAAGTLQGIEKGLQDASTGKAEAIARRQAADIETKSLQEELSNLPRNVQQDPSNAGKYTYLQSSKMENGVKINMYNDISAEEAKKAIARKVEIDKRLAELAQQQLDDQKVITNLVEEEKSLKAEKAGIEQAAIGETQTTSNTTQQPTSTVSAEQDASDKNVKAKTKEADASNKVIDRSNKLAKASSGLSSAMSKATMGAMTVSGMMSSFSAFNPAIGEAVNGINNFVFGLSAAMGAVQMVVLAMNALAASSARAAATQQAGGAVGMVGKLSMLLTNPYVAIGAIAVVGAVAAVAWWMNKTAQEAEKMRKEAVAAFAEPTEAARFFGQQLKSNVDALKAVRTNSALLSRESREPQLVDPQLAEAVKKDYADLIGKINTMTAEGAATELAMAFNNMVARGLSVKEAKSAITAIADEAGQAGGLALATAFTSKVKSAEDVVQSQIDILNAQGDIALDLPNRIAEAKIELANFKIPENVKQAYDAVAGLTDQFTAGKLESGSNPYGYGDQLISSTQGGALPALGALVVGSFTGAGSDNAVVRDLKNAMDLTEKIAEAAKAGLDTSGWLTEFDELLEDIDTFTSGVFDQEAKGKLQQASADLKASAIEIKNLAKGVNEATKLMGQFGTFSAEVLKKLVDTDIQLLANSPGTAEQVRSSTKRQMDAINASNDAIRAQQIAAQAEAEGLSINDKKEYNALITKESVALSNNTTLEKADQDKLDKYRLIQAGVVAADLHLAKLGEQKINNEQAVLDILLEKAPLLAKFAAEGDKSQSEQETLLNLAKFGLGQTEKDLKRLTDESGNLLYNWQSIGEAILDAEVQVLELESQITKNQDSIMDAITAQVKPDLEASKKRLNSLLKEKEAALDAIDARRKAADKALQEDLDGSQAKQDAYKLEQDRINKLTDNYVDSIKRKSEADSYYANQAKTGLSAIQQLASGDVFGFLSSREQMGDAATEKASDEAMQNIEDRRKAELDLIQEKMDREAEYQKQRQIDHDTMMTNLDREARATRDAYVRPISEARTLSRELQAILNSDLPRAVKLYGDMYEEKALGPIEQSYESMQRLLYAIQLARGKSSETAFKEVFGLAAYNEQMPSMNARQAGVTVPTLTAPSGAILPTFNETTGIEGMGGATQSTVVNGIQVTGFNIPYMGTDPAMTYGNKSVGGFSNTSGAKTGPLVTQAGTGDYTRPAALGSSIDKPIERDALPTSVSESEYLVNSGVYFIKVGKSVYQWAGPNWVLAKSLKAGGMLKGYPRGGRVSGAGTGTSDSIPAMLSHGEYVVKASSVKKYGTATMDAINSGTIKMMLGGDVTSTQAQFLSGQQLPGTSTGSTATTAQQSSYAAGFSSGVATPLQKVTTNTSMVGDVGHGSLQQGPNGWPNYSYEKETKKIPGTNTYLTMNKDVLPLFLAIASDYNRLIRPVTSAGGAEERSNAASNHTSGTAVDINADKEATYLGWGGANSADTELGRAFMEWWRSGKISDYTPFPTSSPSPARAATSIVDKYKIIQWFGPTSLGGYISDPSYSDFMHFQISQSQRITPEDVAQTISSLGINPDGTTNSSPYVGAVMAATGGLVLGPGSGTSDSISAKLSNGEYVMRAAAVQRHGLGLLDSLNKGNSPKFSIPNSPSMGSVNNVVDSRTSNSIVVNVNGAKDSRKVAADVLDIIEKNFSKFNNNSRMVV